MLVPETSPKITRALISIQLVSILVLLAIVLGFDRKCDLKEQVATLQARQIILQDQQINELQHQNIQIQTGASDAWGNPLKQINIDTLKYAAYTEGYNTAIRQLKDGSGNGYTAGYHAAIFDLEKQQNGLTPTIDQPVISPKEKNDERQ